jgi:hypothetical protein
VTVGPAGQQVVDGVGDRVGAIVGCGAGAALGRWRVAAGAPDAAAVADALAEASALEAAELTATGDGDGADAPWSLPPPYM